MRRAKRTPDGWVIEDDEGTPPPTKEEALAAFWETIAPELARVRLKQGEDEDR